MARPTIARAAREAVKYDDVTLQIGKAQAAAGLLRMLAFRGSGELTDLNRDGWISAIAIDALDGALKEAAAAAALKAVA